MPLHHDIRTVTVPGCVDGWIALHDRFGTMPLADLLAPATRLAQSGFPASPLLAGSLRRLDDRGAEQLASLRRRLERRCAGHGDQESPPPLRDRRGRRAAFYEVQPGAGLIGLGNGLYTRDDLARSQADWVEPRRRTCSVSACTRSRPTRRATWRWPPGSPKRSASRTIRTIPSGPMS